MANDGHRSASSDGHCWESFYDAIIAAGLTPRNPSELASQTTTESEETMLCNLHKAITNTTDQSTYTTKEPTEEMAREWLETVEERNMENHRVKVNGVWKGVFKESKEVNGGYFLILLITSYQVSLCSLVGLLRL